MIEQRMAEKQFDIVNSRDKQFIIEFTKALEALGYSYGGEIILIRKKIKYTEKCPNPKITRDGLLVWYDGYHTAAGVSMYNPQSVVFALKNNQLSNYWTSSGPYDEIFYYIRNNILDVQDDLALMISGESVPAQIQEYAATVMELKTKDEIYSAMVVYGLLTYKDGYVSIPNRELMNNFAALLKKEEGLGYVYKLAKASAKMLEAAF